MYVRYYDGREHRVVEALCVRLMYDGEDSVMRVFFDEPKTLIGMENRRFLDVPWKNFDYAFYKLSEDHKSEFLKEPPITKEVDD